MHTTRVTEPPPGHVFVLWEVLAEIDPRKVAEVVRRLRHKKNNASVTHFFALSPKPTSDFAGINVQGLVFSGLITTPAKFHPNPSKFPRFIGVTIYGDPIGDRIADNKNIHLTEN